MLLEYYNGKWFGADWGHLGDNSKKRFEEGKDKLRSYAYNWNKVGYILYKYEIQNGAVLEKIREYIFKED